MILAWREHIRVAEFQFSLRFWVTLHFLTAILLAHGLLWGCFSICKVGWMITILAGFFFCTSALLAFLSHDLWLQPQALARSTPLPGGASGKEPACQCMRLKRCGFNPWVGKIPWRRTRQPTPVFLPGEFHGQRSLAGYSPWSLKESDTTEQVTLSLSYVSLGELWIGTGNTFIFIYVN